MKTYRITPRDLLFFRDGRPLDRNKQDKDHRNIGHGAFWPRPDHLYYAVLHALVGSRTEGENTAYGKFGGLKVSGPFPLKRTESGEDTLFLPRPLDWDCELRSLPKPTEGETDAPAFLRSGFIDREEGKKDYPAWISENDYQKYLSGDIRTGEKPARHDDPDDRLFFTEPRIGNTLDAATGASKRFRDDARSGQYEAQYLRLAKGVTMWAEADPGKDGVAIPSVLVMGGQNGLVDFDPDDRLKSLEKRFPSPVVPDAACAPLYVRWTLLAPALFSQTGWRPGWVDADPRGKVRLKERDLVRGENEPRAVYKARQAAVPELNGVFLEAAFVGKPVVFSGFDAVTGIKDTQLAVPAGSCYVFRCDTNEAAEALVARLHLQRKSDFGSQGFGVGVCSFVNRPAPWTPGGGQPGPSDS